MNTQIKKHTIMARLRNFIFLCLCALVMVPSLQAEHLMIIAVNDTHSQIDPASDGKGGVAPTIPTRSSFMPATPFKARCSSRSIVARLNMH